MAERLVWDIPNAVLKTVDISDSAYNDSIAAGIYQDPREGANFLIDGKGNPAPPLSLSGVNDSIVGGEVDFSVSGGASAQTKMTFLFGDGTQGQDTSSPFVASHAYSGESKVPVLAINDFGQTDVIIVDPVPPTFASIAPTTVESPAEDTEVTLTGTKFETDTVASINGVAVETTYVSATSLKITVPATDLDVAGTVTIGIVGIATTKTLTVT